VAAPDPPFAEPVLLLSEDQYWRVVAHCYDGLPDEACGLLAGTLDERGEPTGVVTAVYPCVNADASARTYSVDSGDYMHAKRDAEGRGEDLVGVWHSHTHSDAYPSDTDVRQAFEPQWTYVLVSLKHAEPVLRSYRIRDGVVRESETALAAF
jgi:[CysO sulfur-carrier protein]-S-L-cysteine hydrolase